MKSSVDQQEDAETRKLPPELQITRPDRADHDERQKVDCVQRRWEDNSGGTYQNTQKDLSKEVEEKVDPPPAARARGLRGGEVELLGSLFLENHVTDDEDEDRHDEDGDVRDDETNDLNNRNIVKSETTIQQS